MSSDMARVDPRRWKHAGRLGAAVCIWGGTFWSLSRYGADLLPAAIARNLTLQAYLTLVQLATLGVGLGAAFALLEVPSRDIPLRPPGARALTTVALVTPLVFATTTTTAFLIARPTLIAELMAGGREAAQSNTGQFGRELVSSSALLGLFWGAIVSPISEEMFFRGALYAFVHRVLANATLATIAVAVIFGYLHWDLPGGLGIIRFVSALGLGLACGLARQATKSVGGAILLHALFNFISFASVRRWVVTEAFPTRYGAPTLVTAAGVAGLIAAITLMLRWRKNPVRAKPAR